MSNEQEENAVHYETKSQSYYRPRFSDDDSPLPLDLLNNSRLSPKKQLWQYKSSQDTPKVLDPDDPLMTRFQNALKTHLTRINEKLKVEVLDLEAAIKDAKKKREEEGQKLYNIQQEIARQQVALENYQSTLAEVMRMREEKEEQLVKTKELHKKADEILLLEKSKEEKILRELESLMSLQRQFAEWEKEITSNLIIFQRMSEKDAAMQYELLRKKQQEDYILFKLMEEIWKIESEIKSLDKQIQIKSKEKLAASQTVADSNADLEALQREYKNLFNTWNSVISNIGQRDKINDELSGERQKIRESFQTLQSQIEKLKKETNKEMENNERLTSLQSRIEEDIQYNMKMINGETDKINNLEAHIMKLMRLSERTQSEYDTVNGEYQLYNNEEKILERDFEKLASTKIELEDKIISKLEEKVTHDKAARHLNKLLRENKDQSQEQELLMIQAENAYGKTQLEMEKLNCTVVNIKYELNELTNSNIEKEKEIDQIQAEIRKCDTIIAKKQRQIVSMNKKIEEALLATGGEEISPLDLKIVTTEKNIEETDQKNQKAQQLWLRQEGYMVTLSQQRNVQLQEINLISKQITIMEQKNLKLEYELEKQRKEAANMNRTINLYQQKLVQINSRLAAQKELKDELEDKNYLTRNEYVKSLKEAEMVIIKLQNDIRQLENEKITLKEQLSTAQRDSLSWEKKVQLAYETSQSVKHERSAGGDVAIMKSEIHKMEMRLSHLRKAQEKLIQDMEFCVARRDVIVDGALAKEKKSSKGLHNQRAIFQKRLDDQRLKIKQVAMETKKIESKISELEPRQREIFSKLNEGQKMLRAIEDVLPDIDKEIMESELIKQQNLESLIRKQHKVKMLQDIRDGRYKMFCKSEAAVNEELHKQQTMNIDLKEIMEQTKQDFPFLKADIRKILLTLDVL